jgi:hypothetical protein
MIISFRGNLKAGKTTAATYVQAFYQFKGQPFHRVSLAGPLKAEVINELVADNYPNFERFEHETGLKAPRYFNLLEKHEDLLEKTTSFRQFCELCIEHSKADFRPLLQWWGTEFRRKQDENYWINKWILTANRFQNVIVDDIRFYNELRALQQYAFKVYGGSDYFEDIGIRDPAAEILTEGLKGHESESLTFNKEPHPTTVINNFKAKGTEDLYNSLDEYLLTYSPLAKMGLAKV